ncbi:uncharacterized protein [Euphorbia lathyris]|uniref:uncharacterized protein isoform X2 n=1 Tax=Euphorbia lathyris TaxID=212925 RepID=UPI003313F61D
MASCALVKPLMRSSNEQVYVGAVPLRASKGAPQLLMSTAYSLNLWDLHHFFVIVQPPSLSQGYVVFDFQPKDPENIYTALAVLSGRAVPGDVLVRNLKRLPRSKCWLIGSSKVDDAIDVATKFNDEWDTDLRVGHHDCRHYTNGLVELLTGQIHVTQTLRQAHS